MQKIFRKIISLFALMVLATFLGAFSTVMAFGNIDPNPGVWDYELLSPSTVTHNGISIEIKKLSKINAPELTKYDKDRWDDVAVKFNNSWIFTVKNLSQNEITVRPKTDCLFVSNLGLTSQVIPQAQGDPSIDTGVGAVLGFGMIASIAGAGSLDFLQALMFPNELTLKPGESFSGVVLFAWINEKTEWIEFRLSNPIKDQDKLEKALTWKFKSIRARQDI